MSKAQLEISNIKTKMSNEVQITKHKFDLEERTSIFAEEVIDFLKLLGSNPINRILISQLTRSACSIGANYMEADAAESKKDFKHKISICKKEAKETRHWLRMVAKANPDYQEKCRQLWREAHELLLIFSTILKK
ncbi:MAG: hypothetical protein US94_C0003G0008 [Berkelbacteria bacterium GW2011_GWB1_38_5]|uniref:Four helix bundle protein n=1 Tax=Berkelbacteria bacterium GW2011_GWB1_38_5 TaxID=1618336 RepID=A0A0G0KG50_9BACT|nr:MAG: hypothetical protein US94_C0003G0008 [Berkelbacteria bacterium GW2011_GWB1_38_5]